MEVADVTNRFLSLLLPVILVSVLLSGCIRDAYPDDLEYSFNPYHDKGQRVNAETGESEHFQIVFDQEVTPRMRQDLQTGLKRYFGTPAHPLVKVDKAIQDHAEMRLSDEKIKTPGGEEKTLLEYGSQLYRRHCLYCHGLMGDASGPTGQFLNPKPRDFRNGLFKFKSTTGTAPNREDLLRTIRAGVPTANMPSFGLLGETDLQALASYVIHLALRGRVELTAAKDKVGNSEYDIARELEGKVKDEAEVWLREAQTRYVPKDPPGGWDKLKQEGTEEGRKLFESKSKGACADCHGVNGRSSVLEIGLNEDRRNNWGDRNPPRDLTLGNYRGGSRPIDVFWRIKVSIPGSDMSAAALTDEEIWQVVAYVLSLSERKR